jgi:hypothetical protein
MAVTCSICGRERTDADFDYSPMQAVFGQQFGWLSSSEDGEICGDCLAEMHRKANQ